MASKPPVPLPVEHVEGSVYKVGSESVPGKTYLSDVHLMTCVDGDGNVCKAREFARSCKHLKAALAVFDLSARQMSMSINGDTKETSPPKAPSKVQRVSQLDRMGYQFDEVTSAMQKEIRNGDEEAAVYWALLLYEASMFYAWKRVLITAAEDVGLASPETVSLVAGLARAWEMCKASSWYVSPHHLTMAVMALCRAPKSTEVEDLQSLTMELHKKVEPRAIPSYAIDGHTAAGKARGVTWAEWYRDRHQTFGIPVNQYVRRLWDMVPDWKPELEDMT